MTQLRIAGLTRLSTCDWPDHLVATMFLQGCPWDCFYCQNPELIDPRVDGLIDWDAVVEFARRRVGLLDGFVFSGGEPTMQRALPDAMDALHELGFSIGLHSCGAFPRMFATAIEHADWVGLDIKELPAHYSTVTGRSRSGEHAWKSLDALLKAVAARDSGERSLDYEVRTTVHTGVMSGAELGDLAAALADRGVRNYAVQQFRGTGARAQMPVHLLAEAAAEDRAGSDGAMLLPASAPHPEIDRSVIDASRFHSLVFR